VKRTCHQKGCTPAVDFKDFIQPEDGWKSVEEIEVFKCAGECASSSHWSEEHQKYRKQCACCGVGTTTEVEIDIVNVLTKETKKFSMQKIATCGCAATQCEVSAEELNQIKKNIKKEIEDAKSEVKQAIKSEVNETKFSKVQGSISSIFQEVKDSVKFQLKGLFGEQE